MYRCAVGVNVWLQRVQVGNTQLLSSNIRRTIYDVKNGTQSEALNLRIGCLRLRRM